MFKVVSQNLPELNCLVTLKWTYQTGLTQLIPPRITGSPQSGFRCATAYTVYHNCIMNLQDNGRGTDYDAICAALFKRQDDMAKKTSHQTDSNRTAQTFVASGQITNQDGYTMGKPGPDGQHRCYYCQGETHISRYCPKNLNNELQTLGNTNPAPVSKDNQAPA